MLCADWRAIGHVLALWIQAQPGTRPWGWWVFDAPRWRREDMPARSQRITVLNCAEPRRRLGGVGTPAYEVLNIWPHFERGLPTLWVTAFQERYYNGRARDVDGNPIGTEYHEGHFAGLAPRAYDPPTFESEASYLDRHGLLTAEERERLSADAYAPTVIEIPTEEPDSRAEFPHTFDHPCFDQTREDDGYE